MIYKHRDTQAVNNFMKQFTDGKYICQGLVNSKDTLGEGIWMGANETGFAIMNSASYNLNTEDDIKLSGYEGRLMKMALQNCKDLSDFETLLDTLQKPTKLEANFGVIDAYGGAAYYELGNHNYVKVDANDSLVAPYGYIIRTNYSFSGKMGVGGGYIRYQTASDLFYEAVSTNKLDAQYILQNVTRSLKHSLTGTDLYNFKNISEGNPKYVHFRDYIPRTSSSSSMVIQGVTKDENPDLTTLWTIVGFPLTSVIIPTWIIGGEQLPEIVMYNSDIKDSPICNAALELKKQCFPIIFGKSGKYYLNINALVNADNSGYTQMLAALDQKIFDRSWGKLEVWNSSAITKSNVQKYYNWLDETVKKEYKQLFNLTL